MLFRSINIAGNIRDLSNNGCIPFILKYLNDRKFSSFTYSPGGPPGVEYIRHSTFDVNDGRQSFGIQNTCSFIQEGMNGEDDSIDNLQQRAEGQMTGMRGLLEFVYGNKEKIKVLVSEERKKLLAFAPGQSISVQSVHVSNGKPLMMPLLSYSSGKDTLVRVKDYRPLVRSLHDVQKPLGYLIPKDCTILVDWAKRMAFKQVPFKKDPGIQIGQYLITAIDSIDFEGDIVVDPQVVLNELKDIPADPGYLFIPADQLKGNLLVLALEPKSMLGLVTYEKYSHLLKSGQPFPVLRVTKK